MTALTRAQSMSTMARRLDPSGNGRMLEQADLMVVTERDLLRLPELQWAEQLGHFATLVAGTTQLSVFNAFQLADGPIATARLNQAMPPGLHGSFATTQA